MHTCTKKFEGFAAAHRQHRHDGHCALIHGHNFAFEFTFTADRLDENQFVVDFGKLKWLRQLLTDKFDHTLLLNEDDPSLKYLRVVLNNTSRESCGHNLALAKIEVVPNCGAEGLAEYLFAEVNIALLSKDPGYAERGVRVLSVVVWEDEKNSASYSA